MLVDTWRWEVASPPVIASLHWPTLAAKAESGCPVWFDLLSRWKIPELVLFLSPSETPAFLTTLQTGFSHPGRLARVG